MAWCGHNENMASSLTTFALGLAVQTVKRAATEKVSTAEIPALEIEEIDALLTALHESPARGRLGGVMAVGSLIRHFYQMLGERLKENPALSSEDIFQEEASELNRLLFGMEEHYYTNLRPKFPRLEAIRRIREYLEEEVK